MSSSADLHPRLAPGTTPPYTTTHPCLHTHTPPRSVGTVFFSALTFGAVVVALHGAVREPDNLFTDDRDDNQSFLSILSGAGAGLPAAGLPV
jgi:hypothetical protein